MFRVTLNWDGFETTAQFYNYEYALRDFKLSVEISEKFRANGLIKKYSVELKNDSASWKVVDK